MTTNLSSYDESLQYLTNQWIPSAIAIVFSFAGIVLNGLIIGTIAKNKSLRSKFLLSISLLAASDLLYCLAKTYESGNVVLRYALRAPEVTTPEKCVWHYVWQAYASSAAKVAYIAMALERLSVVTFPTKYCPTISKKYATIISAIMFGLPLPFYVAVIARASPAPPTGQCGLQYLTSRDRVLANTQSYFKDVSAFIFPALTLPAVGIALIRLNQVKRCRQSVMDFKNQLDFWALQTLFWLCVIYTFISAITAVLFNTRILSTPTKTELTNYWNTFMTADSVFKLFVYLIRLPQFRLGFRRMLGSMQKQALNEVSPQICGTVELVF